jgi:hypothetical protein
MFYHSFKTLNKTSVLKNPTVVVAAKSITDPSKLPSNTPDPKSAASTVTTVAREIASAGGEATPIQVDVRSEESVNALVAKTIAVSLHHHHHHHQSSPSLPLSLRIVDCC